MSDYRLWYVEGGTYFFTVVTERRIPVFNDVSAHALWGDVIQSVSVSDPFEVIAIVLLPAGWPGWPATRSHLGSIPDGKVLVSGDSGYEAGVGFSPPIDSLEGLAGQDLRRVC